MSLDPATNSMAVTGGEDDKAFVWRVSDGEVLLECTGEGQTPPSTTLYCGVQVDVAGNYFHHHVFNKLVWLFKSYLVFFLSPEAVSCFANRHDTRQ